MRSPLLLSAALLGLSVAAATTGAHAQGAPGVSTQDSAGFNTSGPGVTSNTNGNARPASGYGAAPARARLNPGGTSSMGRHSTEPGHSLDSTTLNSSGPGATTSSGVNRAPSITRSTNTAQAARAAGSPGNGASAYSPGTTATQTAPGYNTSGPGAAGQTNPAGPSATLH